MGRKQRGRNPFLIYLISLAAGVLVLTAVYLPIIVGQSRALAEPSESSAASASRRPERPPASLLVIGDLSGAADLMLLLRLDGVNERIVVMALPGETRATLDERTDTLAGFYAYAGPLAALGAAQELLGVSIDRYMVIGPQALTRLCDGIGVFDYTLPREIAFRDEQTGVSIAIGAGPQQFDGGKLISVVTADRLAGAGLEGAALEGALFAALLRQNLSPSLMDRADGLFTTAVNETEGNLSMADYVDTRALLRHLAELPAQVQEVEPDGAFSDDGREFYLSENSLLDILRYFS